MNVFMSMLIAFKNALKEQKSKSITGGAFGAGGFGKGGSYSPKRHAKGHKVRTNHNLARRAKLKAKRYKNKERRA